MSAAGIGTASQIANSRLERSSFPDAWFNLGVLQEKIGRDDEALLSYEKAFAMEPSYADALHNAALLLMRKRQFSAAVKLLDQLVSTSQSTSGEARRLAHLCRLELKQGVGKKIVATGGLRPQARRRTIRGLYGMAPPTCLTRRP